MNNLPLSADETVFYSYNTGRDELTVQLERDLGPTEGEPSATLPLVELRRSTHDGAVVALRLKSVQEWLLHSLVRDLASLLKAAQAEEAAGSTAEAPHAVAGEPAAIAEPEAIADAVAEPEAIVEAVAEPEAIADAIAEPEAAATESAEPEADAAAEPEAVVEEKPKRGRRRKKSEPEVEAAAETESPAVADAPAEEKPKRGRRKKVEPEVETVAAEASAPDALVAEADATAEPTVSEEKPKRGRRKKSEPVAEAAAEPVAVAEPEAAPEEKATRGRRRKKSEPDVIAEAEPAAVPEVAAEVEPIPAPEAVSESEPEAADESEPEVAAADDESDEADIAAGGDESAEDGEGQAKRKRRRRRRGGRSGPTPSSEDEGVAEESGDAVVNDEGVEGSVDEGTEEELPAAAEGGEGQAKRKRRRRRGGRGRNEDEGQRSPAASAPPAQPQAQAQPPAQPQTDSRGRPARGEGEGPEEDKRPRRAYKTSPIPGLGAPEGFAFLNMNPLLGQALMAMGFEEPTPIQKRAVPVGIEGRDVIGLAQTGTGKTVAYLIPALHRLLSKPTKDHRPRLLVLAPTRELALQVTEEAEYLATHTDLLITTIYGGVGYNRQLAELKEGTDIVIATPGRLLDLVNRGSVKLNSIETLVLDEADRMLDMGFLPEIRQILSRVPKERQTLLFSATMPPQIQSLSLDFQRNPEVVEVARQLPPASIAQAFYPVERHLKTPLLVHMLQSDEAMTSVLVFTETKADADVVTRKLKEANVNVAVMHGDRNQREREQALQSLRDGTARVLVATDVAARGLDVTGISHVVNYHVPQSVDDYVHRIGRTARGDASGRAYTFISSGDEGIASRIEGALDRTIERERAPGFNYDVETPSWAKPSAADLISEINKPKNIADRFRRMNPRRR